MNRVTWVLAAFVVLVVASGTTYGYGPYGGHGHYGGPHGGFRHAPPLVGHPPVWVHPPVIVRPSVLVPYPVYRPLVYPPVYDYGPLFGIQYYDRRFGISLGF